MQRETHDRHDGHVSQKLRSTTDALGLALVVDETGRIRRIHYAVNVKNPALQWDTIRDNERPIGCGNVDVARALKKGIDRGGLGWRLLVDMYEDEGRTEEWERVYQLYASTAKKVPVPEIPDEWLPVALVERRKSWVTAPKPTAAAVLGPNPYAGKSKGKGRSSQSSLEE